MAVGDYLCEFKHLSEVDVSFVENTGQRLDIVKKFPRIIGDCWREREKEREKGRERKRESGPTAIPGIPLIWSYMPCLMD